jgi:DNA-binding winged helix-turn-helix (wHTH) protein/predicted ATPase
MIPLRPKAFAVLTYLLAHAGQLVTKEALLEAVWPATAVSEAVLKTCIGEIRKALGETAAAPRFIATVSRRGYRFLAPVTPPAPAPKESQQDSLSPLAGRIPSSLPRPGPVAPEILVERDTVLRQLHTHLAAALQGHRQVVLVTGEPGIGKTAVIEAFTAQVALEPQVYIAWGRCVEQYGAGEAYMPVLEALGQLCRGPEGTHVVTVLRQQAPTWLAQMPWLLSIQDRERLQHELRGATRERMLRELAGALETLTTTALLVLVLEDLHWSDHATLDLLTVLAQRREPARLLVLGTYRPVEVIIRDHPLRSVIQNLQLHGYGTALPLTALSEAAIAAYLAARLPGCAVPEALVHCVYQRTDGNPLFLVNVVEHLVSQGVLMERAGHWELQRQVTEADIGVPESLRQMLAQQLERLDPDARRVIEAASVAGVEFTAAAVAAGLAEAVEQIEVRCEALGRQGHLLRPGGLAEWPDETVTACYRFQHTLYQEVAYQRLGATRRVHLHRQIGVRLEGAYGTQAPEVAAELAEHFVRGRDHGRAVQYLQQAAQNAMQRYAPREAVGHLTKGLGVLESLPDTPERIQQALTLHLALGVPLLATKGYAAPEVEQTYRRAQELCQQQEDTPRLFSALRGLWDCSLVRAELLRAHTLVKKLLDVAQHLQEPALLVEAHRALGTTLFFLGMPAAALPHLRQALAFYRPTQHAALTALYGMDPGITCQLYAASTLWLLGYAEQGRQSLDAAMTLAQEQAHPFSLAFTCNYAANFYQRCREPIRAQEWAEAAMTVSRTQGFPFFLAWSTVLQGWALAEQGQEEAGMTQLHQGLAAWRATGAELTRPYMLAILAEMYGKSAQATAGLKILDEALAAVDRTAEHWWEAELYRLKGELLQQVADDGKQTMWTPEACLQQALVIARRQQAKVLELRAAMSLSRLWQQQGQRAAVPHMLAEVYSRFTEGLSTADLREARALLVIQEGNRAHISP